MFNKFITLLIVIPIAIMVIGGIYAITTDQPTSKSSDPTEPPILLTETQLGQLPWETKEQAFDRLQEKAAECEAYAKYLLSGDNPLIYSAESWRITVDHYKNVAWRILNNS